MHHPLFIVDVFAEEKYAGNQLAVVLGGRDLRSDTMQRIARETNFSETTFVLDDDERAGVWETRIFTPTGEIPFAGHPTLGTAWVIRHHVARHAPERLVLGLGIGPTPVRFADDDHGGIAWLSAGPPEFGATYAAEEIADVVGLDPHDIDSASPIEAVSLGVPFTFVPVRGLEAMARARFRVDRFEARAGAGFAPCLFLFCRDAVDADNDVHARMFATPFGITEDPATGSANACLGAYLVRHGLFGAGPIEVRVEQGLEMGRPSLLRVRARPDSAKVEVGGRVIATARGELL